MPHQADATAERIEATRTIDRGLLMTGDMEEEKQLAGRLIASELRYRRLFETARDGILILDYETGLVLDANPFVMEMLDLRYEDVVGQTLWDLGFVHDAREAQLNFESLKRDGYVRYDDLPLKTRDGRTLSVEFVSNVYSVSGRRVIQCNIRDITQRKALQAELHQSQKMEAIGQLTGGIAHDFNNLLTVIMGYSEIMLSSLKSGDPLREEVQQIVQAGHRASMLTRQLLAFSHKQVVQPQRLDFNRIVANLTPMLRRLIGEDIELVSVGAKALWLVYADPSQIEQAIVNLTVNARDAMPQGGKLTIETANVDLDENFTRQHPSLKPGAYVMLSVIDTGSGMDADTQAHLFEPFFTTKEKGKGTGLGLSTVYRIIQQSGGSIFVHSEPGLGTAFTIYLPRVEGAIKASEPAAVEASHPKRSETVLLVEDEDGVRILMARILAEMGYQVVVASNGETALSIFEQRKGQFNLLVTDLVMPGMGGGDLAARLAPLWPGMKVLYISGYADHALLLEQSLGLDSGFLQKPFTPEVLGVKVREVLDSQRRN